MGTMMQLSLIKHPFHVYVAGEFEAAFTNFEAAVDTAYQRYGEIRGACTTSYAEVQKEWNYLKNRRNPNYGERRDG